MRNGHRDMTLTTQAGDLDQAMPKLRAGSFPTGGARRSLRVCRFAFECSLRDMITSGGSPRTGQEPRDRRLRSPRAPSDECESSWPTRPF
ncbi:transposase [Streptomyces fagopyri]|uniref:transposase n=1 Tax=Streptomyces fagopyri TaxID=2662397 RepID=UPI003677738C